MSAAQNLARLLRLRSERHTPEDRLAGSNLGPKFDMRQRTTLASADLTTREGALPEPAKKKPLASRAWQHRRNVPLIRVLPMCATD